jgi:hypothetical protein
MANEFVTRTGLIVSGSTYLPSATSASKGYILSFDDSTKQVYYMSTSSVTVTVPGSDTQIIYNNGGAFGASSNFVFSGSRVGIGTTTPGADFDIQKNSATAVRFGDGGSYPTLFSFNTQTGDLSTFSRIKSLSSQPIILSPIGNDAVTILTTGNVGIGTTSPSTKFVVSNAGVSGFEVDPTGGVSSGVLLQAYNRSTSAYMAQSYYALTHTFNVGSGAGTRALDITSTGNIGIGTSSPGAKLNVRGGNILIDNTTLIQWGFGDGTTYIYGDASNPTGSLKLGTANADRLTVTYAGNVGIGTTNPQNNLHISGAASSDASNIRIDSTTQYGGLVIYENNTLRTILGYGNAGNIFSNAQTDSTSLRGANYLHLGASSAVTLTINSSDNVGIGTTSPSQKLEVSGSGYIIKATANGSDSSYFQAVNGSYDYIAGVATSLGYGLMGMNSNHALAIMTSGSERMRITSDGNVGIGTTSPSEKLHVIGNTIIQSTSTGNGTTAIRVNNSAGTQVLAIGAAGEIIMDNSSKISTVVDPTSTQPQLELYNGGTGYTTLQSSTSYGLLLNPNGGNVGIGKTSPNAKLDISGSVLISGSLTVSGSSTFTNIGPAVFTGSITQNASTASFGGLVGIGTTTPGFKLQVNGDAAFFSAAGSINSIITQGSEGKGRFYLYDGGNATIGLQTNGPSYFNAGNVLIGTTTDAGFKLDVSNGSSNVYIRAITSGSANWATLLLQNGDGSWHVTNDDTGTFNIGTTNDPSTEQKLSITSTGNVGIGITSPSTKLEVESSPSNSSIKTGGLEMQSYAVNNGWYAENLYFNGATWRLRNTGFATQMYMQDGTIDFNRVATGAAGTAATLLTTMRLAANGNVGIGTTTPSNTLQVAGGVTATSFTGSFSGSVSAPGSTTQIVYNSGGALAADSGLVYSGSRVGIGISSPSYKLDVDGDIRSGGSDPLVILQPNSGTYAFLQKLNASNGDFLRLYDGTDYSMFWKNTNVGIGTSNPSAKLQTVSSGLGDGGGIRITNSGAGGDDYRIWPTATVNGEGAGKLIFSNNGGNVLTLTSSGNVGIGTINPTGKLTISQNNSGGVAALTFTEDESTIQGSSANTKILIGGNLSLNAASTWIAGTNGSERMRITSGGNVGIGTTSPGQKLTLINGTFQIGGTSTFSDNIEIGRVGSDNNMAFATGGTERMRITSTGNVGIGTTSPTSQFHIYNNNTYSAANINETTGSLMAFKIRTRAGVDTNIVMGAFDSTQAGLQVVDINASASTQGFLINPYGGNVGIGVTSPTYNLEVSGSGYISGSLTVAGTITAQKLNVQQITSSVIYSSGSNIFGNSLANTQTFTGSLQVTGSTHYLLGNVGIGTTSPNRILDVNGVIRTQNAGSAGAPSIELGTSAQGNGLFSPTTNTLAFTTNDNERIRITSGGNVGIGTTSPAHLLSIYGTPVSDGALNVVQKISSNAASSTTPTSGLGFGANYTTGGDNAVLSGIAGGKENATSGDFAGVLNFYTRPNGGNHTERMRITSGGNVGIGTTTPSTKLFISGSHVSGQGMSTFKGSDYAIVNLVAPAAGDGSNGYWGFRAQDPSFNDLMWFGHVTSSTQSGFVVAPNFDTANSASLYVARSNGNVGIGTTSPTQKLEVAGKIRLTDDIQLWSANPTILWESGALRFYNNSTATERMRITDVGNVGIGTTNPSAKLQVNGASLLGGTLNSDWAVSVDNLGTTNANGMYVNIGASSTGVPFAVYKNFSSLFYVTNSGNVGIGTTSPSAKLEIKPSGDGDIFIGRYSGGSAKLIYAYQSSADGFLELRTGGDNIVTKLSGYNGTPSYFLSNVGIGTTSPGIGDGSYVAPLTINSTSTLGTFLAIKNTSAQYGMGGVWMQANTGSAGWLFGTENDGKAVLHYGSGASETAALTDAKDGTKGITIDTAGNVGIGTTSPAYKLQVSGSIAIENQGTTTIESTTFSGSLTGNTNIAFVPTGSFKAAFFDYYVASGSISMRAGTIMAVQNNSTSRYTDTSTADIGNTAPVDFSTSVVGGNLVLTANIASGTWEIKTAYRAL